MPSTPSRRALWWCRVVATYATIAVVVASSGRLGCGNFVGGYGGNTGGNTSGNTTTV